MLSVAIVNDLAIARRVLRRLVEAMPGYRVVWEAAEGRAALEQHARQPADIVLLDLVMPVMDGVQTTALLMKLRPCAILLVTSSVTGNRNMVFTAMSHGALDAVDTPDLTSPASVEQLRRKLQTVSRLVQQNAPGGVMQTRPGPQRRAEPEGDEAGLPRRALEPVAGGVTEARVLPVVAIGASTGGPQALATILRMLPIGLPAAVVIVQHLDYLFVPGLQSWLQSETELPVTLARHGMPLEASTVLLSYTRDHLVLRDVEGRVSVAYSVSPQDAAHRPSVTTFFESVAQLRSPCLGILLTGMGRDGATGLLEMKQNGAVTLAQSAASSAVFGMPRAALEIGAAEQALSPQEIGTEIVRWADRAAARTPAARPAR